MASSGLGFANFLDEHSVEVGAKHLVVAIRALALVDGHREELAPRKLLEEHRALVEQARRERAEAVEAGRKDAERLKEEILADTVRIIRMLRPDVITAMVPDGTGGGQHHQASALIARAMLSPASSWRPSWYRNRPRLLW